MKISGLKLLGSVVVALLLGNLVITSALASSPAPASQGNDYGGYGALEGYNLKGVAKLLGIDLADIISQLRQGKTLVQIADDKATEEQLIDTLIAPYRDELQLRVKYEYITQDQADAQLQSEIERARRAINTPENSGYGNPQGSSGTISGPGDSTAGDFGSWGGGVMGAIGGMLSAFGNMMGGFGNSGGMMGGYGGSGGMMGGYGGSGGMMGGYGNSGGMMGGYGNSGGQTGTFGGFGGRTGNFGGGMMGGR